MIVSDEEQVVVEQPMARKWAMALASWGIPQPILDAAARDPWGFPVARFAGRADRAVAEPGGTSYEQAAAALRNAPGSILDVGAGAGAASLPLAPLATQLTAVDNNEAMLDAFSERAESIGIPYSIVQGSWPTVAPHVAVHELVVAHHIVYNVPAIGSFSGGPHRPCASSGRSRTTSAPPAQLDDAVVGTLSRHQSPDVSDRR